MEERRRDGWHIDKRVQITHLITTLVVVVSTVLYIAKIEQRIAVLETQATAQRESFAVLRDQLGRVESKLDRLIERWNGK